MRPYLIILTFLFRQDLPEFEIINGDTVIVTKRTQARQMDRIYGDRRSEYCFINGKEEGEYRWYDKENNTSEQGFLKMENQRVRNSEW